MVKIDVNQDYYADLELPQSVDTETVKKQYRKLGKFAQTNPTRPCLLLPLRSDRDPCALQPSNTTPTGTPAARSRPARGSRESRPPTKSSQIPSRNSDTTTRVALASPARPASRATPGKMSPRTTLLHRARQASPSVRLPPSDLVVIPAPIDTPIWPKMPRLPPLDPAGSRPMRHGKLGRR